MTDAALNHALRGLARGWRSGRLLILGFSLLLAVAATGSVDLFTARVRLALERQSGETLGADALLSSRDPLPETALAALTALGLQTSALTQFPSVALFGEATQLASVKAVSPGYPLRGQLRLAQQPYGPATLASGIPKPGEAWVDLRLLTALGAAVGDTLQLGRLSLRASALIAYEPDRGGGFADLAPRLLMNAADLAGSGLVGPGSRAGYRLQVAGPAAAIAKAEAIKRPAGEKFLLPKDARPELRSALARAGRFLDIVSLAAALLAAAAVALTARGHGNALQDEIALLKTLGARQRFLLHALSLQLLLLGLAAGLAGAALAYGGQLVIGRLLGEVMKIELPAAPLAPLLSSISLGLLMLFGFALPPVLAARRTPPLRVLAREVQAGPARSVPLLAAAAVIGLLLWRTGSPKLALIVLGGVIAATLLLGALAWLAVQALTPLRQGAASAKAKPANPSPRRYAARFAWRFGLANIARRRAATVGQAVALGLGLLALLLISVVRQDLLESWRKKLPADTPNQFLINIQPDQVEPLRAFFRERGLAELPLWPMLRGRLVALNGQPVTADSFADEETRRWVNREFNLSWTDRFGSDNQLLEGEWWDESARGQNWLSVDDYAVERLKLKLGDTLGIDFAGSQRTLTVHNIRKVSWDSFKPNFFLVTPPGVLDSGDSAAGAQWLTSFYLKPGERRLLSDLLRAFPNITALDLDAAMSQVRGITEQVVSAVEFVFLFALAAGLMVLLAAIHGTREERARETALLRALGASSATLRAGLLTEYALLGLIAGFAAALAAQGLAWALAAYVFEIPYGPRPLIWLIGTGAGMALVTALGWLSMRNVLATPPRAVLA